MIALLILVLVLTAVLLCVSYVLGFRLGMDSGADELQRVRLEAARAQDEIHQVTASAFMALADEVVRRRRQGE